MVSRVIALKALSKLTGIDNLNVFHKVLFINGGEAKSAKPRLYSSAVADKVLGGTTVKLKDGIEPEVDSVTGEVKYLDGVLECYMICSKTKVYFLELDGIRNKSYSDELKEVIQAQNAEEEKAKLAETVFDSEVKLGEIKKKEELEETDPSKIPGLICKFDLTSIVNVFFHTMLADRFALAIDKLEAERAGFPAFIALSSCHRKKIIEDVQISHDTAMITYQSKLAFLIPKPLGTKNPQNWPGFRHPTIIMFNTIPDPIKRDMKPFYRCGYLFLGPKNMEDTSMANLYNRHSCTYSFPSNDVLSDIVQIDKRKHLLVRVMPEKPIRSTMPDSNLNFHLWVESIAWAMAQDEVQKEGVARELASGCIFIPERGVYRKKMNITGDESMYHCFRLHIFTKTRQIGVIGVRRKYIPPLIDCFQDLIFVLKGKVKLGQWTEEPNFMQTLERMVDSISPSAMDWRADSFWSKSFLDPPKQSHPTYIDKFIIQQQADALLCNHDVYSWLRNRKSFKIVPSMRFNGKECHLLAVKFCRSTCRAAYDGKIPMVDGDSDPKKMIASVKDPISIIKRFEASAEVMLSEQNVSKQVMALLLNNWRMRVSKYFAHVVDCYMPSSITIVKLAKLSSRANQLSPENKVACAKVTAFLLYMHKRGGVFIQPSNSVMEQISDPDLMSRMECNEVVLLKLLSAGYFERMNDGKDSEDLTTLLSNLLLRKSNNLDIIRAVCRKIRRKSKLNIPKLIEPLMILAHMGNAYSQTYAFQALAAIAKVGSSATEICKRKGVEVAMHVVSSSPSRELIQAAVSFLSTIVSMELDSEAIKKMSKIYFLNRLKYLISPQILGQRNNAPLLSAVARLIMCISQRNHHVLFYMVISGVIKELVAIIEDHSNYYRILIPISACLGTIFVKLGSSKSEYEALINVEDSVLNDSLRSQAQTLVLALKRMMNQEGLQVALNLLIVLKHMVMLVEDKKQRKKELLDELDENYAFEHVLNRCRDVAAQCEDIKQATGDNDTMWATIIAGVRGAADWLLRHVEELLDNEKKI